MKKSPVLSLSYKENPENLAQPTGPKNTDVEPAIAVSPKLTILTAAYQAL